MPETLPASTPTARAGRCSILRLGIRHRRHLLATDNPTEWLDENPANYLFRDADNLRPTPELLDQTRQRFAAILTKPRMSK